MSDKNCDICGNPKDGVSPDCPRTNIHLVCTIVGSDDFDKIASEGPD